MQRLSSSQYLHVTVRFVFTGLEQQSLLDAGRRFHVFFGWWPLDILGLERQVQGSLPAVRAEQVEVVTVDERVEIGTLIE